MKDLTEVLARLDREAEQALYLVELADRASERSDWCRHCQSPDHACGCARVIPFPTFNGVRAAFPDAA